MSLAPFRARPGHARPGARVALAAGLLATATGTSLLGAGPAGAAAPTVQVEPMPTTPAISASCAPATRVLSSKPKVTALPGRATMRVWQSGSGRNTVRIVAVTVPRSSALRAGVYRTGSLTSVATVRSRARKARKAVVMVNGPVYAIGGTNLPAEQYVSGPQVKLSRVQSSSLAIDRDGRAGLAMLSLTGRVTTPDGTLALNAVNQDRLASSGVSLYTRGWGSRSHPVGTVELLVRNGTVTRVRPAGDRGDRVPRGSVALTGRGSAATSLRALKVGDAVTVKQGVATAWQDAVTRPEDRATPAVAAIDLGKRVVRAGHVVLDECGPRDELRRPRTAVGWTKTGTLIVMAISGRPTSTGEAVGGATSAQVGMYLRRLGAVDGSKLDGGGSTTMYVRTRVGGTPKRVDRPGAAPERQVSGAFGVAMP